MLLQPLSACARVGTPRIQYTRARSTTVLLLTDPLPEEVQIKSYWWIIVLVSLLETGYQPKIWYYDQFGISCGFEQ